MDELKINSLNKTQKTKLVIDLEFEFVSETLVIKCYAQHHDYLRNTICYTATPLSEVELIILKFSDILGCYLVTEEKAQQAQELARTMSLDEWDGLVVVSGDGLVFEILNGLAARDDAPTALKIPLGIVPGGSGNALAAACCFDAGSSVQFDYALDAAFTVARPILKPLKLIHIHSKEEDFVSFMGLGWGILADIDIESEKFRRLLGGSRFFASGVVRFANLRTYSGRLCFKLAPNADDYSLRRRKLSASKISGSKSCPNLHRNKNNNDANRIVADNAEVAQEAEYFHANFHNKMGVIEDEIEFTHHLKINDSNANFYPKKKIFQPITNSKLSVHLSQFDKLEMPALDQPVPQDWTRIEGDFYSVYLIYLSHLGSSCPYMPESRLDDDLMYLTLIRTQSAGRLDLLKFLTNMSNGSHLNVPCVEVYPVVAFRMERSNEDNILTVDGENIKCVGPVQACLSHLKANVMTSEQCSA